MSLNGFLVIDKPVGLSSHDIVSRVRRALNQKKVGHTGTLDPFATGVLPVALGEGTKCIQFLDEAVKEYRAVVRFGIATDTQDRTGRVIEERDCSGLTPADLEALLPQFTGTLSQLPPMYSALKRDGVPLYRLARQGVEVERELRRVEILSLTWDWIRLPEAAFTVRCSRGTYVRTLANDLGEALGCGAHLLELRRTQSGTFTEAMAISLDQLAQGPEPGRLVLSVEQVLSHLKELPLDEEGGRKLRNGVAPGLAQIPAPVLAQLGPGEELRLTVAGRCAAVARFDAHAGLTLARVFN